MEFAISDNFAEAYADKDPGWGFNGLGYIVYKRTYARPVAEGERTEEWHETIQRVVNGAQAIGAGLTQEEKFGTKADPTELRAEYFKNFLLSIS